MSCTKTRYRDRIAALNAMSKIHRKDGSDRSKMEQRAYRCPDCGSWHLTARTARRPRNS